MGRETADARYEKLVERAIRLHNASQVVHRVVRGSRSKWSGLLDDIRCELENQHIDIARVTVTTLRTKSDTVRGLVRDVETARDTERATQRQSTGRPNSQDSNATATDVMKFINEALTDTEKQRVHTYSAMMACHAARRADVAEFRANVLGGDVLSVEAAGDFLAAPRNLLTADKLREDSMLSVVVKNLVQEYPWLPDSARWFVLTNQVPMILPIRVEYGNFTTPLGLFIAPWVSVATIAKAYRYAQRKLLPEGRKRFQPQGAHDYSRSLHVTEFYYQQLLDARGPVEMKEIYRAWNEQWASLRTDAKVQRREEYREEGGFKLFMQDIRRGMKAAATYV